MGRFTEEQIAQVNQMNIIAFMDAHQIPYQKAGNSYKIPNYGGLYVNREGNKWHCFSDNTGGGIIQFMMKIQNCSWVEAMKRLLSEESVKESFKKKETAPESVAAKKLILPKKNSTYKHLYAYLIQTRKIDKEIVDFFVQERKLYENSMRGCTFVGYDEKGIPRYASWRSTSGPYKGDVAGSDKSYGFYKGGNTNKIFVFESPIELMSFCTLQKDSNRHHFLSLGGLSDNALQRYLKNHPEIEEISLCYNNDENKKNNWGQMAAERHRKVYEERGYQVQCLLPTLGGDFNEMLVAYRSLECSACFPDQDMEEMEMVL